MKRKVVSCKCADYGSPPHIVTLFGGEYCFYCQSPDEMEWWDETTHAQRAAYSIWNDLQTRRGFDEEIDDQMIASVLEEWAEIIQKEME